MIVLEKIKRPEIETDIVPVVLTDETMELRKNAILDRMKQRNLDSVIIWADLEHGSNFEYFVGFLPRFEEALLVLHKDGQAHLVLGNENLNKADKSRIKATAVHMPHFSLPNQPMMTDKTVSEILSKCSVQNDKRIGIVGWKNFTSKLEDNSMLFDIPDFIMCGLREINSNAKYINVTDLLIGEDGIRVQNNANEFAHYEFGAALAGNCILKAMDAIEIGKTEMDVAKELDAFGQYHSVVTIMATGARFEKANMYPINKQIQKGDTLSITTGFKGGLQSRGGYAVDKKEDLP
ncbi:aminopeptidase P family N-terminal domain-containing protein, partial [Faecalitalea cylindroides]